MARGASSDLLGLKSHFGWAIFKVKTQTAAHWTRKLWLTFTSSGEFPAKIAVRCDNSITQNITTTPGSSYVVSFWLAASVQGGSPDFSVNWGGSTIFSDFLTSPFGYMEYTFTVKNLAGDVLRLIQIR